MKCKLREMLIADLANNVGYDDWSELMENMEWDPSDTVMNFLTKCDNCTFVAVIHNVLSLHYR